MALPRGIYYEQARQRYRVRLYYEQQLIWRSYHYEFDEAVNTLRRAQEYRRKLIRAGRLKTLNRPPEGLKDLL